MSTLRAHSDPPCPPGQLRALGYRRVTLSGLAMLTIATMLGCVLSEQGTKTVDQGASENAPAASHHGGAGGSKGLASEEARAADDTGGDVRGGDASAADARMMTSLAADSGGDSLRTGAMGGSVGAPETDAGGGPLAMVDSRPRDAAVEPDATTVGVDSGILLSTAGVVCGATTCASANLICCLRMTEAPRLATLGGNSLAECVAPSSCETAVDRYAISCDGPEDCAAGQSCCPASNHSSVRQLVCATACRGHALCHVGTVCANTGKPCDPLPYLPTTYGECD